MYNVIKFVKHEVSPLEAHKDSPVYKIREALNNDNGKKLTRKQKNWLTKRVNEGTARGRVVLQLGYAYIFDDYMKVYVVKQYGNINEYYAVDKTSLRSILRGKIDYIIEVPNL